MAMSDRAAAKEALRRKFRAELKKAEEEFRGDYASELNALLGLSKEEIDMITPDGADLEAYNQLISVVKLASRQNVAAATLRSQIRSLGTTAVEIAKKVPKLAALLA